MKKNSNFIPNTLTLLNLFLGCIAIVLIFNGEYIQASLLIFIASVCDFLDGTVARLLDARSELGKQLDSLADVVSFGVAPASLLYLMMVETLGSCGDQIIHIEALPAFLISVFSALRLAKFNIDSSQSYSFRGLPTPANALFIATFPYIRQEAASGEILPVLFNSWLSNYYVLLAIVCVLSLLMISRVPLMGLKLKSLKLQENMFKYLFLVISLVLILFLSFSAAPFILLCYFGLSVAENRIRH